MSAPPAPAAAPLKRELAALRLEAGERLLWAGPATRRRRAGLLACTGRRVAWIRPGLFGMRRTQWPVGGIDRVEVKDGAGERATVLVWARRGATFQAARRDAQAFAAAVASASAQRPLAPARPPGGAGRASKAPTPRAAARARLERVERLRRKGDITDAEYQADRDRLLGQGGSRPGR